MGKVPSGGTPRVHTYVIDHDLGFAPNPFHGVCTLACCKPDIRKHAREGDLIIGTGSMPNGLAGRLSYWMRVDRVMTFDEYWLDPGSRRKRPDLRGSLVSRYGDNIYHRDAEIGSWVQADSFHSHPGGVPAHDNLVRDTAKTDRVLLGRDFCYWGGGRAPLVPPHLQCFVHPTQGHKNNFSEAEKDALLAWLGGMPKRGWVGDPANWPT